ncbi:alpha/beta fold hydrolase [Oceanicella sp. SM1341]|uniref:alpha/beta fold hydrolase n=1 Tax=Oceanicella sp. SM1341 TaxID=1548889 RepID=UPI000E546768|nr:alpha/beta hydrolase [Oceanicella sp. SM1341]
MSAAPRVAEVMADGLRTRYLVAGEGPPLVLLHGTTLGIDARATWLRTIPALAARYRVHAPDMPGFGGTEAAADGAHMSRPRRSAFVRAFLEALGLSGCVLVGHSEGGFVATHLALDAPHLCRALVVVASGATAPATGDAAQDAAWAAAGARVYDLRPCDTEAGFLRTIAPLSLTNPPDYLALMRGNYRTAIASGQRERLAAAAAAGGTWRDYVRLQEEHLFPRLGGLSQPALLAWAACDETVPVARALRLHERMPGADLHVFARAAHMVMIDRPEAFNALLLHWLEGLA